MAPHPTSSPTPTLLHPRDLNRATLARQLLLRRASGFAPGEAVAWLVGLQGQNVKPPYFALWSRLEGFRPQALSALIEARELVRIVTMRSTLHLHTADDALTLRPLVQAARDRELKQFRAQLAGVDLDRLGTAVRAMVEERPYTMGELREALSREWPGATPAALAVAARCRLPLVQVTPRGLWGRSGQVALTTVEQWLGRAPGPVPAPDATVLRYLGAFGPASVKDMQTWAGLTRLGEVFERLRPELVTFRDENGAELFDLPDAPRPAPDTPAPPRFLPEFDNLLLSHADRGRVVPPAHRGRAWKGNQAFRTLLVDGFLAGVWRIDEGEGGKAGKDRKGGKAGGGTTSGAGGAAVLTVEPFGPLTPGVRDQIVAEGERLLVEMAGATSYDIRFGNVTS
ncbi:winged helix DNA-binding domain-containing protein [Streptomyces sp. cg36]|uniref:winged helix DNA-binding domain-containing protein n=1 Tax=Streptomyces sp. cg36 TaxID=3238798 RepID=UPI0034E2BF50